MAADGVSEKNGSAQRLWISAIALGLVCTPMVILSVKFGIFIYSNERVGQIFSIDGADQTSRLVEMLSRKVPYADGFFNYGGTQNTLGFLCGKLLALFGSTGSFADAAMILQFTQLIAWISTGIILLKIGLRLTENAMLSFGTTLVILSSVSYLSVTYEIHPDGLQLFLVSLALLLVLNRSSSSVAFGMISLGLSIGAKYSTALYVPLILYLGWESTKDLEARKTIGRSRNFRRYIAWHLILVGVAFLSMNLSILVQPLEFLRDVVWESRHVGYGHGEAASANPIRWLPIFNRETRFLLVPAVALGSAFLLYRFRTQRFSGRQPEDNMLLGSTLSLVTGILHLLVEVRYRQGRYMIYLMPLMFVVLTVSISKLGRYARSRQKLPSIYPITLIVLAIGISSLFAESVSLADKTENYRNDVRLRVGELLISRCSSETRILAPAYSYVPPQFNNVATGSLFADIDIQASDLLVLNRSVPGRHIWPTAAGDLILGSKDKSKEQFDVFKRNVFDSNAFESFFTSDSLIVLYRRDSAMCSPRQGG